MSSSAPPDPPCPRCGATLGAGYRLDGHCASCLLELTLLAPLEGPNDSVSEPWIQMPGFELFEELGRGGSGVVYRGRQLSLDRMIAVKILRSTTQTPTERWQRFQREAQAAGRLQHPAIVRVFDTGVSDSMLWLSMEFIDGKNLQETGANCVSTPKTAATLVCTLAEAISHAHEEGVLHRDLKPSNILIDHSGAAHITDFGLASLVHGEGTREELALTRPGEFVGSPGYAAPELSLEGKAGKTTDVYGLGGVLYFLLSGEPPVQGKTLAAILAQQREAEPLPLRHFNRNVPRDLELICAKCLRREPNERYGSAEALAEDLRRFLSGDRILARPPSVLRWMIQQARRRPGLALLGLATGTLMLALVTSWFTWQQRQKDQERRTVLLSEANVRRQHRIAGERAEALRQLQDARQIRPGSDLVEAALAWLTLPEIGPRENVGREPTEGRLARGATSADGSRMAVISADGLNVEIRDLRTGAIMLRLPHPLPVTSVDWSGELIATGCENRFVYIWDDTGHLRHRLSGHQGVGLQVKFRPRGQELVSVAADPYLRIWHAALGTEIHHRVVEHPSYDHLAWNKEGNALYARANGEWDRYPVEWSSMVEVLAPPAPEPHTENLGSAAFDRTGTLAAVADEAHLRVWDFERGYTLARYPKAPGQWLSASFARTTDTLWLCGWDLPLEQIDLRREAAGWSVGKGRRRSQEFGALLRDADSHDKRWMLSQNGEGRFFVYEPETERTTSLAHAGTLAAVLDPQGRWAATSSYQLTGVRVWSLPEGEHIHTLSPEATARQMLCLPGERLLVDTSLGPRLFSTDTWQPLTSHVLPAALGTMTLNHDGRWLATLGAGTISLWRTDNFKEVLRLPLPEYIGWPGEAHLIFSRGSSRLLLHTAEGTVVRWDLAEAEKLLREQQFWPESGK